MNSRQSGKRSLPPECGKCREHLDDYRKGFLTEPRIKRRVEDHLARCADCARECKGRDKLTETVRMAYEMEMPSDKELDKISQRLMVQAYAQAHEEAALSEPGSARVVPISGARQAPAGARFAQKWMAVAAAVALVVLGGWLHFSGALGPRATNTRLNQESHLQQQIVLPNDSAAADAKRLELMPRSVVASPTPVTRFQGDSGRSTGEPTTATVQQKQPGDAGNTTHTAPD